MVSILLTCYEWDVCSLVEDLLESAQHTTDSVEIVVLDDASPNPVFFQHLSKFKENQLVRVFRNEQNLGRSKTRNKLVSLAKGDLLIFIDGDSRIASPKNFIENYIQEAANGAILVGGRAYTAAPSGPQYALHWNYGRKREVQTLDVRRSFPKRYFFSNNFCCFRDDFIPFDESFTKYGYEDSLWASEAINSGLSIIHIDNFVIHIGLHTNEKFISNAREAVTTLAERMYQPEFEHIRLAQYVREQRKSTFGQFLLSLASWTRPISEWMLCRGISNLKLYDFFRVGLLQKLQNKIDSASS